MQLRRFVYIVAITVAGGCIHAEDQAGAERHKKVVGAQIVKPGGKGTDGGGGAFGSGHGSKSGGDGETIGNVQVTYLDGTKDLWTTKGNCSLAKAAPDSTVGWTVHGEPVRVNSQDFMRPNPELVTCRQGKVLAHIRSELPFIEEWKFLEGGSQLALRCRASHGPADIELHETATGKLITTLKARDEKLPAWAKSLKDE
ncbi:MAG TPA: hypothetical protein VK961_11240 [Chthoniobacter sp.]|nr:hypothetical protein [Chthoniobacter sp.]